MSAVPAPAAALSAQDRLARSRMAITGWLAVDEAERAVPGRGGLAGWLARLRGHPLAGMAVDALGERWSSHPLAATLQVAEAAAAETVAPLVRRHPAAMLGASALAGALLVRAKPWRWLLRPALLGGIASQLVAQIVDRLVAPASRPQRPDRDNDAS